MRLDLETTIQAAGVLLARQPGQRMSYLRLLKLLYLADRRMLAETGRPITFDSCVAMDNGPVLSGLYDVIKGTHLGSSRWSRSFEREDYTIHLRSIPERGRLSSKAIEVLQTVQDEVEELDDWSLVSKLHAELNEWQANRPKQGSACPIDLRDILLAVGYSDDEAQEIRASIEAEEEANRLEQEFLAEKEAAKDMRDAS